MTGQKNRFKTTEKLWNLDDKQLATPKHDAMVLWLMDTNNLNELLEGVLGDSYSKRSLNDEGIKEGSSYTIKSEVPLQAQNGFINGYADLIITQYSYTNVKHPHCDLPEPLFDKICSASTVRDIVDCIEEYDGKPVDTVYLNDNFHYKCDSSPEMRSELEVINKFTKAGYWVKKKEYDHIGYGACDDDFKLIDFVANSSFKLPHHNFQDSYYLKQWIVKDNYYEYEYSEVRCLIEVKPYIDSFGAVLRQLNSYQRFWKTRDPDNSYILLFTFDTRFDNQFLSQGIIVLHPPADITVEDMMEMYGLR